MNVFVGSREGATIIRGEDFPTPRKRFRLALDGGRVDSVVHLLYYDQSVSPEEREQLEHEMFVRRRSRIGRKKVKLEMRIMTRRHIIDAELDQMREDLHDRLRHAPPNNNRPSKEAFEQAIRRNRLGSFGD